MWASHLFNRVNPKPLVLAQAVKVCHYTRASQRPSAEGSSLWETVYSLLRVLLSGVSCNVTFSMTWGLRLEKYRCCSRSEGQQWRENSSKAKPWRKSMLGPNDAVQEMHAPPASPHLPLQALCAMYREEGKKVHDAENKPFEDFRRKIIQSLQPKNSSCTLEITLDLAKMFRWLEENRSMHTWFSVFIAIFM